MKLTPEMAMAIPCVRTHRRQLEVYVAGKAVVESGTIRIGICRLVW